MIGRATAETALREACETAGLAPDEAERVAALTLAALVERGFFVGRIRLAQGHLCHGEACDNVSFVDVTSPLYEVVVEFPDEG